MAGVVYVVDTMRESMAEILMPSGTPAAPPLPCTGVPTSTTSPHQQPWSIFLCSLVSENNPRASTHRFRETTVVATQLAAIWFVGRALSRRTRPASFPTNTTYWLARTGVVVTFLSLPLASSSTMDGTAFASRVVEYARIPDSTPFRWWVRSQTITTDDGMLIGGIAGVLLASRSVVLPSLSPFHRCFARLGAFHAGSLVGIGITWTLPLPEMRPAVALKRYQSLLSLYSDPNFEFKLERFAKQELVQRITHLRPMVEHDQLHSIVQSRTPPNWLDTVAYKELVLAQVSRCTDHIEEYSTPP
jgi:hypothetical protein